MSTNSSTNTVSFCESKKQDLDVLWATIRAEASELAETEPQLSRLLDEVILSRNSLAESMAARLARKLAREDMSKEEICPLLNIIFSENENIVMSVASDMTAIYNRDPACQSLLEPMLFFKGFMAITIYRVSHHLWAMNRRALAFYFQSISSEIFGVDIHPGARIGCGIFLDHATSIVIGETAIVEDDVSIMHEVTLGGTGKQTGARHPIVRSGVLIGAGAKILGRVEIGKCAKIGAGSVVLDEVRQHTTVAGVPAVVVGETGESSPALDMNQSLECGQI